MKRILHIMKRIFIVLLVVASLLFSLSFFIVLNLWGATNSSAKIKSLAADSELYSFATTYIRDEVVNSSNISINDDASFDQLNEAVSTKKVTATINSSIDDFFSSVQNKADSPVFPIEITTSSNGQNYNFSKKANFTDSPALYLLRRINYILLILAACVLLPLILAVLLSKTAAAKLKIIGRSSVFLALFLGTVLGLLLELLPHHLSRLVASSSIVHDPRLVNAVVKLVNVAVNRQVLYYALEIIVFIVAAAIFLYIAKAETKEGSYLSDKL